MSPDLAATIDHEEVVIRKGPRSGLPVIVGIHSTRLGPSLGGVRLTRYERPLDAVTDCLRLSRAMTFKAASVDNGTGGGKSVVPLLPGTAALTQSQRESVLLDVADIVHSLDGRYIVAPDVGTGPVEMRHIRRRTPYVGGYGVGTDRVPYTTTGTSLGVEHALLATAEHVWGTQDLSERSVTVVGFGAVGRRLSELLLARGARVQVTDIDTALQAEATGIGATWIPLDGAYESDVDILAPCALGGVLTDALVPKIRARAVVGSANNQLAHDDVASTLKAAGITWAPDFVSNAGGILYASGIEMKGLTEGDARSRLQIIQQTVGEALRDGDADGLNPLDAAYAVARARLSAGMVSTDGLQV